MDWKKYKWQLITGVAVVVFSVFYIARAVSGVNHTVRAFDEAYYASSEREEDDTINMCAVPGYINMIKERAFLSSRVKMASSDSIGLLINLPDSSIQLLIKGLPVRSVRIAGYDVSPFFKRVNQEALGSMLSSPMTITGLHATFKKDPVNVKIAPKDTSDVKVDAKPDTTDFEAVFFTLDTDQNIRFFFEQQEDTILVDRFARFFFDLKDRAGNVWSNIKAAVLLKAPGYTPYIKIWLPKAEAKIIYRAVPREGLIVLKQ
jgi:hypothetical protein